VLGDLAAAQLGRPVHVTNLATNDSLTPGGLLERVMSSDTYIDAITAADAVTVQVGFNDWQGACYWPGHDECVAAGAATVVDNLDQILDRIGELRGARPTQIWVIGYFRFHDRQPDVRSYWALSNETEPQFYPFYTAALQSFIGDMCDVAEVHAATCVDLAEVFNGPERDQDAAELLGSDHGHPSQAGHELIAATIDATGYGPLGPQAGL